jgi:dolichol-phosphate mannosyltransferase
MSEVRAERKTLSIIIPVYNEEKTIDEIIRRVVAVPMSLDKELILVDDGSKDATHERLKAYEGIHTIVYHERNQGKGRAIRTGLEHVSGNYVVIQDGDLEYDPNDLATMVEVMERDGLNVLYGSRRLKSDNVPHSGVLFFIGGWILTIITNILYGQRLTDEPTCYKMFRTDFIKPLPLVCMRFEFCPEVTALSARRGERIREIPISYAPRGKSEGKKIDWRDFFEALWVLIKYRF